MDCTINRPKLHRRTHVFRSLAKLRQQTHTRRTPLQRVSSSDNVTAPTEFHVIFANSQNSKVPRNQQYATRFCFNCIQGLKCCKKQLRPWCVHCLPTSACWILNTNVNLNAEYGSRIITETASTNAVNIPLNLPSTIKTHFSITEICNMLCVLRRILPQMLKKTLNMSQFVLYCKDSAQQMNILQDKKPTLAFCK